MIAINTPPDPQSLLDKCTPEKLVGEGKYRRVYAIDGFAVKVAKPTRKKTLAGINMNVPTTLYGKTKSGAHDFNTHELSNYLHGRSHIPEECSHFFAQIYGVVRCKKTSISITKLIKNTDDSISKTLRQHGEVRDNSFWNTLDNIVSILAQKRVHYLDMSCANICVQHIHDKQIPVFVDHKYCRRRTYPFQFLITNGQKEAKMKRRYERLVKKYKR